MIPRLIQPQYALTDRKTRRRGVNTTFFAGASVKAIGETHLQIGADVLPAQLIAGVKSVQSMTET